MACFLFQSIQEFHYQTDKFAGSAGDTEETRYQIESRTENAESASYGAKKDIKKWKQQHINGTENILLKYCTVLWRTCSKSDSSLSVWW